MWDFNESPTGLVPVEIKIYISTGTRPVGINGLSLAPSFSKFTLFP